jgi:hypothetical protein
VQVLIGVEGHEVSEVTLTFRLTARSPERWGAWSALAARLACQWQLKVHDPAQDDYIDVANILHVLSQTRSWQEFAARYKWPPVGPVA